MLIFLIIDKSDEWQLVRYILTFKRFQFLSGGCLSGVIGYIQFFACATYNDYKGKSDFTKLELFNVK